ncbi:hypothetical protein SAMN06264364_1621, partial [Quadrisphaera granulorum]
MLLAPDIRDWLVEDVVWVLRDIVAQLDITALNKRYRRGGTGRMAYDPRML